MTKPDFFTWVDQTYSDRSEVPERLIEEMKLLAHLGATPQELGQIFNIPAEWVEDFVGVPTARLN